MKCVEDHIGNLKNGKAFGLDEISLILLSSTNLNIGYVPKC